MIAHARLSPSSVLVPRPISSSATNDRRVAWFRMRAVSVISTMKVDWPEWSSSLAPMRVKTRSARPTTARSAGTKLPMCASITMSADWRM